MRHGSRYLAVNLRCPCALCRAEATRLRQIDNARRSCFGGITATLRRLEDGETFTVTAHGETVDESLRTLLEGLDASRWRVVALSTVRTIYADVKVREPRQGGRPVHSPEALLLGRIGRLDLIGGAA